MSDKEQEIKKEETQKKPSKKQDGINTYNKYLLFGAEQPTKKVGKKKNGVVTKKNG